VGTELPDGDFDPTRPHAARVYDYLLGGKSNFAADRALAEKMLKQTPGLRIAARENRAFLGRAVQYLAGEAGVRQFLDIGTGLPTAGNVHEVAQRIAPESRVVYADNDRCKSGCAHAHWTGRTSVSRTGAEALRASLSALAERLPPCDPTARSSRQRPGPETHLGSVAVHGPLFGPVAGREIVGCAPGLALGEVNRVRMVDGHDQPSAGCRHAPQLSWR
jgi:hypothetical protein